MNCIGLLLGCYVGPAPLVVWRPLNSTHIQTKCFRDVAQRLSYSSWRRHQTPVSLRPLGARSMPPSRCCSWVNPTRWTFPWAPSFGSDEAVASSLFSPLVVGVSPGRQAFTVREEKDQLKSRFRPV